MDCRQTVLVFLTLTLASSGCVNPWAQQEVVARKQPPTTPAPQVTVQAAPEKPKRSPRPATTVALADTWKCQADKLANNPSQQRQLRDQARRAYQEALKTEPGNLPALTGLAHLYVQMEDFERALDMYHRGLQQHPKQASLYFDLGMCLARRKDFVQAVGNMKKALELDPENPHYVQTLGLLLARAGRIEESLACLTRVQGNAQAHFSVGRMLLHLQRPEAGRHHLALALQSNPNLEPARQLLAQIEQGAHGGSVEIQFDSDGLALGTP